MCCKREDCGAANAVKHKHGKSFTSTIINSDGHVITSRFNCPFREQIGYCSDPPCSYPGYDKNCDLLSGFLFPEDCPIARYDEISLTKRYRVKKDSRSKNDG